MTDGIDSSPDVTPNRISGVDNERLILRKNANILTLDLEIEVLKTCKKNMPMITVRPEVL